MSGEELPPAQMKGKREIYHKWSPMEEKYLLELLYEESENRHTDGSFPRQVMNKVIDDFNARFRAKNINFTQSHTKLREFRKRYKQISLALQTPGFRWDADNCTLEAEPEIWERYIRANQDAKELRYKRFWNLEQLEAVVLYDSAFSSIDKDAFMSSSDMKKRTALELQTDPMTPEEEGCRPQLDDVDKTFDRPLSTYEAQMTNSLASTSVKRGTTADKQERPCQRPRMAAEASDGGACRFDTDVASPSKAISGATTGHWMTAIDEMTELSEEEKFATMEILDTKSPEFRGQFLKWDILRIKRFLAFKKI